ncbi:hypothetical protein AM593_09895, partial [Mytilus galloprovincialis]
LCSALAQKTGSQALGEYGKLKSVFVRKYCQKVRNYHNIRDTNVEADLDPIYFCEEMNLCPVKDDGDAKITQLSVTPKSGPQGQFSIDFTYVSVNGTGTGEIVLEVETVDHIPVEGSFLHELADAGSYPQSVKLKAQPDPNCDPTQGPCEEWMPGNYTVKIEKKMWYDYQ